MKVSDQWIHLYILISSVVIVSADFECVCNYAVENKVFDAADASSKIIGWLYEFDCKALTHAQSSSSSFYEIQFRHVIGYVENSADVTVEICTGVISTDDKLTPAPSIPSSTKTPSSSSASTLTTTPSTIATTTTTKATTPTEATTTTKATTTTTKATTTTTKATTTTEATTTTKATTASTSTTSSSVNGLSCYQCNNVRNISDCTNIVHCSLDENCFTDLSGSGANTRYTIGCRSKKICRQPTSAAQGSLIGRAVDSTLSCSQCCGVALCNQNICSTSVQGLFTSKCEDDPNFNCAQVSSLFNVCADKEHAKLVCRKYCGLCDIVDGHWLEWSSWSTCSQTCDKGTVTRTRMCNRTQDGLPCNGDSNESLTCYIKACPVDGGWSAWTSWNGCSVTCGAGFAGRSRDCSNPAPDLGGKDCVGDNKDMHVCMDTICYDGTWMSWSSWSACTVTCQGGISIRKRQCNATLEHLGHDCVGESEEYMVCNTQICADKLINGMWSQWSAWTACSPYCIKERTRTCTNPSPSLYGQNCLGDSRQYGHCNLEYCSHSVRLVNGSDPYEGRLEVLYKGQWGTVCDNNFDDIAARLVCRTLNYNGAAAALPSAAFGEGTLPILLSEVSCYGDETDLFECDKVTLGHNQCTHANDVSVSCHPSINVRLVNGTTKYNGKLMVSLGGGKWNGLCGRFNQASARVACRTLGLPSFMALPVIPKMPNRENKETPSHQFEFKCSGFENSLSECNVERVEEYDCNYSKDIGLACGNDIDIRLRNGTSKYNGLVEMSVDGIKFGKLCTFNTFTKQDAQVICRMLGLPTNVAVHYSGNTKFGDAAALDTVYEFHCTGTERSLAQCDVIDQLYCDKTLGVDCSPGINVRLANGPNAYSGRVEVSFDVTHWEGICHDDFGPEAARVVCQTLGYPSQKALAYSNSHFGALNATSMLKLKCNGTENNLAECDIYSTRICGRNQLSGVECWNDSDLHVRLLNGYGPHDGRLEVSLHGKTYGPICSGGFRETEAKVACRMLGFPTDIATVPNYFGRQSNADPVVGSISCKGSERSLNDCTIDTSGLNPCPTHNVVVVCSANTSVHYRLVNITKSVYSRFEISFDGVTWGTICDGGYGNMGARVACKSVGLPSTNSIAHMVTSGYKFPTAIYAIRCTGQESSIMDCQPSSFFTSLCSRYMAVNCL